MLLGRQNPQYPTAWSPDARILIFQDDDPINRFDIWMLPLGASPKPLIATRDDEQNARISPDGRWIAYQSTESGRREVYVRSFPNVNEKKWAVSTGGGHSPNWSPDGRELFYANETAIIAVSVQTQNGTFAAGKPQLLFDGPFDATQDPNFDVSPDGQHFVMVEADRDAMPNRLQVVLNWTEELKMLVPHK
jgi:serine/threonine-protein kinase